MSKSNNSENSSEVGAGRTMIVCKLFYDDNVLSEHFDFRKLSQNDQQPSTQVNQSHSHNLTRSYDHLIPKDATMAVSVTRRINAQILRREFAIQGNQFIELGTESNLETDKQKKEFFKKWEELWVPYFPILKVNLDSMMRKTDEE